MNKFKEEDWVRSIVDRYSRTTYMKPCKVIEVIDDSLVRVNPVDTKEIWEVESKNFDYCPLHEILHEGDTVYHKGFKNTEYAFIQYLRYGIEVKTKDKYHIDYIEFDNIVYRKPFKV